VKVSVFPFSEGRPNVKETIKALGKKWFEIHFRGGKKKPWSVPIFYGEKFNGCLWNGLFCRAGNLRLQKALFIEPASESL